jgi:hypothetical protein
MKWTIFCLLIICMLSVGAHLDAGEDVVVDGYLLDFGYTPSKLVEGEKVILAFNLVDPETEDVLDYESLWVRISNEEVVFSGTFHVEENHVGFSYIFAESGEYKVTARFNGYDGVLAENDFYVEVGKEEEINFVLWIIVVGVLFVGSLVWHKSKI